MLPKTLLLFCAKITQNENDVAGVISMQWLFAHKFIAFQLLGRYIFINLTSIQTGSPGNYCDNTNTKYPCHPGKSYHGRGSSYNLFGKFFRESRVPCIYNQLAKN